MFYWSHRQVHVVLTDQEELALIQELVSSPQDRVEYHCSLPTRRKIENIIYRHFENYLKKDPGDFYRKFVFSRQDGSCLCELLLEKGYEADQA